ncbi:hypothetical protein BH11PAT4_BH11PAT4_0260 [soil metagenome]
MQLKPLPDHPFFRAPTRVSRVYPILALILMLVGSGALYRWQLTQINADSTVQERDRSIASLELEVASLKTQQALDQSELKDKREALATATAKLATVESDLSLKTTALVEKERSLAEAQNKLKQQESQLSSNSSELEKLRNRPPLFSFQNQSSQTDLEQQQAELKEVVTSAYDYIQDLYGKPYLLNEITITFVDNFSIAGASGEISIENGPGGISIDIHLKSFDKNSFQDVNTIIHEVIHGFHGVGVLEASALEEGITVAATDAVMERMIADGKLPKFSNLYIVLTNNQYTNWNNSLTIHEDANRFYGSPDISKIYQLVGKAWMNLYREDGLFFKKFNDAYYPSIQAGEKASTSLVRAKIASVRSSVQGVPIATYLSQNSAFNPQ